MRRLLAKEEDRTGEAPEASRDPAAQVPREEAVMERDVKCIAEGIDVLEAFSEQGVPMAKEEEEEKEDDRTGEAPEAVMERVVKCIVEGIDVLEAFSKERVPMPQWRPYVAAHGARGYALLAFTDLEPDDVLAVSCELQTEVVARPVVIFPASMSDKDRGQVFQKKLALGTAAMGRVFMEELIVVGGEEEGALLPPPPAPFADGPGLEVAARLALERCAEADLDLRVLILAPGRGNIAALWEAMKAQPKWPAVAPRTSVRMYTGSFNIRGCTEQDIAAISAMAQASGGPLTDIAHFIWTNNDEVSEMQDLPSTCPKLAAELSAHNPYFKAAWSIFNREFNSYLVMPTHWRLWVEGESRENLTPDEAKVFNEAEALFDKGDVKAYCALICQHDSIMGKIVHYKHNTIRFLASDTLDGPLCDCLTFLNSWCLRSMPDLLCLERSGVWSVDRGVGRTGVAKEGGLCRAVQPALAKERIREAAPKLSSVLQKTVLKAVSLKPGGQKA